VRAQPAFGGAAFWYVVFRRQTTVAWIDRLLPFARFRHVMAVGYFPDARCWIAVDPTIRGLCIDARRTEESGDWLDRVAGGDAVLKVAARQSGRRLLRACWCVPAIAGLVGSASGALRPDGLWRDLVAEGAGIIIDVRQTEGRPGREGAGAAG
jgi:hypothetical protein